MIRRILSVILILSMLCAVCPVTVSAVGDAEYTEQELVIVIDKNGSASDINIPVLVKNGEFYAAPNSFVEMTRFQFSSDEERLIFKLGMKSIQIMLSTQTLLVNFTEQAFSGYLLVEGIPYLPMSELLPWMNVQCYVTDNTLHIDSDPISYWEVIADFDTQDYEFDFLGNYADSTSGVVGLCAVAVFDCILDLENIWKKAISIDDSDTKIYEYEIYEECFHELALPEAASESEVQQNLSYLADTLSDSSQFSNSYFKLLYTEKNLDILKELFGEFSVSSAEKWLTDMEQATGNTDIAEAVLKLSKTCYLYHMLAANDTEDYAAALRYIYLEGNRNYPNGVRLAASNAITALESQQGTISESVQALASDVGGILIENAVDGSRNAIEVIAADTIVGSLGVYLDIIDSTLSLVWPVNKAYANLSKMTYYHVIQYDASNAYFDLSSFNSEISTEEIRLARTSALIFLKMAKKCYNTQDEVFSLFGGKGLVEYEIEDINKKILQFELSALAQEHDAIEDKSEESVQMRNLWSKLSVTSAGTATVPTGLIGNWFFYVAGNESDIPDSYCVLIFNEDGSARFAECLKSSDDEYDTVSRYFDGTWEVYSESEGSFYVSVKGIAADNWIEDEPARTYSADLKITIEGNRLWIESVDAELMYWRDKQWYEKNLDYESWKETQKKNPSAWQNQYFEILVDTELLGISDSAFDMCSYTMYDIEKDGVPELFVKVGTCEADYQYHIFSYKESIMMVEELGVIPGSHSRLCGIANAPAFLVCNGHMGYESICRYTLSDGILISETVFEGYVNEYHQLPILEQYTLDYYDGLTWRVNTSEITVDSLSILFS